MNHLFVPLNLSPESVILKDLYPSHVLLKDVYCKINNNERLGVIRLWITEGIPYAFKDYPLLYEEIRAFIAKGVSVHTKEVTLVGSARIGYSLSEKEWGRKFNNNSDLDFTIISNDLYERIVQDFQKWTRDLESRRITPKDYKEMLTWINNIEYLDQKIPRGFIQLKLLPYHINYPEVKKYYDTIWLLKKKLIDTPIAPNISKASIRVYSSWKTCINQIKINFSYALNLKLGD